MCKKVGLIGDLMSFEKSFRLTFDIFCIEDIFNFKRSYNVEYGVFSSCGKCLW